MGVGAVRARGVCADHAGWSGVRGTARFGHVLGRGRGFTLAFAPRIIVDCSISAGVLAPMGVVLASMGVVPAPGRLRQSVVRNGGTSENNLGMTRGRFDAGDEDLSSAISSAERCGTDRPVHSADEHETDERAGATMGFTDSMTNGLGGRHTGIAWVDDTSILVAKMRVSLAT